MFSDLIIHYWWRIRICLSHVQEWNYMEPTIGMDCCSVRISPRIRRSPWKPLHHPTLQRLKGSVGNVKGYRDVRRKYFYFSQAPLYRLQRSKQSWTIVCRLATDENTKLDWLYFLVPKPFFRKSKLPVYWWLILKRETTSCIEKHNFKVKRKTEMKPINMNKTNWNGT